MIAFKIKEKVYFTIIFLFINVLSICAQDKRYVTIVDSFIDSYNKNDYKNFYSLFAPELKSTLSFEEAKQFYTDLRLRMSELVDVSYFGVDNQGYALYKATFDNNEKVLLNLSVSGSGELLGFRILDFPYDSQIDSDSAEESYEDMIYEAALSLPNTGEFAIALIDKDAIEFVGLRKKDNTIHVINNKQTVFTIGNFNTVFTSIVLGNAITEKKLNMADAVNSYFPFPFKDSIILSFSSLATNSSFLPILPKVEKTITTFEEQDDFFFNYSSVDLEKELKESITIDSLSLNRRSRFSYVGYALLGESLSRVYNKDFTQLIVENVFLPYRMKSTSLVQNPRLKVIRGLDIDGNIVNPSDFNLLRTSTGGFSTVEDLAKFVQANFNTKDKVLQLIQKPVLMIGPDFWSSLGWKISNPTQPDKTIYFSKGIDVGYCNYVGFSVSKKKGIVILTNSSTSATLDAIDNLAYKLMYKLLQSDMNI